MMLPVRDFDDNLLEYCTERQKKVLLAIREHKSLNGATRALGLAKNSARSVLIDVQKKAAAYGYSPRHDLIKPVAPGFVAKGHSTAYDLRKPGAPPIIQWVKTQRDEKAQEEIIRAAISALAEDVRGLSPAVRSSSGPKHAELLTVYPLGDPHFGMYAWAKETGEGFDIEEARRLTLGAVDRLVDAAPASSTAIVLPLGDVFHADDQSNQTPAHKNQLDVDSRYVKVLQVGIQTFRHCVLRALEKHDKVVVRFVSGNHDPHAVWALAFSIAAYFDSEPRVEVDLSPSKFWYYRHGRTLIGATHGDTIKTEQLLGVMATDRAEDWGATRHRYWYTGHVHHQRVMEFPGVVCESFRTLAARDAWAAGHGYRAGRDMRAIVLHTEHGEIERHRCDVGMIA